MREIVNYGTDRFRRIAATDSAGRRELQAFPRLEYVPAVAIGGAGTYSGSGNESRACGILASLTRDDLVCTWSVPYT